MTNDEWEAGAFVSSADAVGAVAQDHGPVRKRLGEAFLVLMAKAANDRRGGTGEVLVQKELHRASAGSPWGTSSWPLSTTKPCDGRSQGFA